MNQEERIMSIGLRKGKPAEQVYDQRYRSDRAVVRLDNFSDSEMQKVEKSSERRTDDFQL